LGLSHRGALGRTADWLAQRVKVGDGDFEQPRPDAVGVEPAVCDTAGVRRLSERERPSWITADIFELCRREMCRYIHFRLMTAPVRIGGHGSLPTVRQPPMPLV
jgi:hypothetical protein